MSLFHVKFNSALIIQYSGNHNNYFVNKYNYSMQLQIMKKQLNFVQKKEYATKWSISCFSTFPRMIKQGIARESWFAAKKIWDEWWTFFFHHQICHYLGSFYILRKWLQQTSLLSYAKSQIQMLFIYIYLWLGSKLHTGPPLPTRTSPTAVIMSG